MRAAVPFHCREGAENDMRGQKWASAICHLLLPEYPFRVELVTPLP